MAQRKYPEFKVGKLKIGDELVSSKGLIRLKKIESKVMKGSVVYDPQLDGNHTYYADGFLVHNPCQGEYIFTFGVDAPGNYGDAPTIDNTGLVTKNGDDICVTNGRGF